MLEGLFTHRQKQAIANLEDAFERCARHGISIFVWVDSPYAVRAEEWTEVELSSGADNTPIVKLLDDRSYPIDHSRVVVDSGDPR